MIIQKEKISFYIANTRDLVSLKLKLAILGQNWKEDSCFRHHKISSPLDGIYGSKAVDKTLLKVSEKKERKKLKRARIFSPPRVLIVTKNLESLLTQL